MGIIDTLPEGKTRKELEERGERLVRAVADGKAVWQWASIVRTVGARKLTFWTMADAIKVDGVRVDVSATDAQRMADYVGAVLPTALICDLVFGAAPVKLKPSPQTITASTTAMKAHSARVDKQIAGRGGLVADVGKDWVLTEKLTKKQKGGPPGVVAANYGWHVPTQVWGGIHAERTVDAQGWVIQGLGTTHDRFHVDYSQVARLVSIDCEVDGKAEDIRTVLQSKALASLISHEGALTIVRQPGVAMPPPGTAKISGESADPHVSSAAYLAGLHPSIRVLAEELLLRAPVKLALVSGLRSNVEQDLLYAQGRTRPGPIVTYARGGQSWHNFGLAFDVAELTSAGVAWPNDVAWWTVIGKLGESLGLTWGGRFVGRPDWGHFEYHPGVTLAEAGLGKRPSAPSSSALGSSSSSNAPKVVGVVAAASLGIALMRRRRARRGL